MLSGRDRNKTGKVIAVDTKSEKITVEGLNLLTRFQRAKRANQKGQKVRIPAPVRPGKLMLICPNCGKPSRMGTRLNDKGLRLRVCKKCGKDV